MNPSLDACPCAFVLAGTWNSRRLFGDSASAGGRSRRPSRSSAEVKSGRIRGACGRRTRVVRWRGGRRVPCEADHAPRGRVRGRACEPPATNKPPDGRGRWPRPSAASRVRPTNHTLARVANASAPKLVQEPRFHELATGGTTSECFLGLLRPGTCSSSAVASVSAAASGSAPRYVKPSPRTGHLVSDEADRALGAGALDLFGQLAQVLGNLD